MTAIPYRYVGHRLPLVADKPVVLCGEKCWHHKAWADPPRWAARWTPSPDLGPWSWLVAAPGKETPQ